MSEIQLEKVPNILDFSCIIKITTNVQVFDAELLKAALQAALEREDFVTDDCSAVERLGKVVFLVDGDEENIKITTPVDMVVAEAILEAREE